MKKTILFLHHGQYFGGATVSLLYTLQALNKEKYNPIVVLVFNNITIINYFQQNGFNVITWPNIHLFTHNTGSEWLFYNLTGPNHILRAIFHLKSTRRSLKKLISTFQPDLIYLNSVVFALVAFALQSLQQPIIWHIREHPPKTFFDIRTKIVRSIMNKIKGGLIFISNADRKAWLKSDTKGNVIYNFVDFTYFNRGKYNPAQIKNGMAIDESLKIILYLGGFAKIKGILILLEAVKKLRSQQRDFIILMPGTIVNYSTPLLTFVRVVLKLFGTGTTYQKATSFIQKNNLSDCCIPLEYQTDVTKYFAIADIVVFPSTTPHFARPAIEAAAMGKPVIASDLPGMEEAVIHNTTGILVIPKQPSQLCEAIAKLLNQDTIRKHMGENAFLFAKNNFNKNISISAIENVIEEVLNG